MSQLTETGESRYAQRRITVADMQDRLIPLDDLRNRLAATEPVSAVSFDVGTGVRFSLGDLAGFDSTQDSAPVEGALVSVNGSEYQLTKEALLEATSTCGLPKGYVTRTPAALIEPQLNYWMREGLAGKQFKFLSVGDANMVHGFARNTIQPFSNLEILDRIEAGIRAKYGSGDLFADYKFTHSLADTRARIIIPEVMRRMEDTGRDEDNWSIGVQFRNSLIGADATQIDGYLFAWWCTNGSIDTRASSGAWSRRGASGQTAEVYDWARTAVDDVLGGLEHSLDKVQALVHEPVAGETADVLRDVFEAYRVPGPLRAEIIENMVDTDQLNMYSIMQAITQVANGVELRPGHVEDLMRVGGDLPNVAHERCGECHRLMTH
jgi:hypothetical protein